MEADFSDHLLRLLLDAEEAGVLANNLFVIPGVYEILAEHYNNHVLERISEEKRALAPDDDEDEDEDEGYGP